MKDQHLEKIKTCIYQNRIILAIDEKFVRLNNNQPLEFEMEFQKKELVFRASLVSGSLNTDQPDRIDHAR